MGNVRFATIENRQLKLIVTGTGRCATGYVAKWLSSIGIICGHEAFFDHHGLPGALIRLRTRHPTAIAEASWEAAPHLGSFPLKDAAVIHLVRHPKKVIESCVRQPPGTTPKYLEYLEKHLPRSKEYGSELDKAACRWVYWNRLIADQLDGRASYFWRIEDGETNVLRWLGRIGLFDFQRQNTRTAFHNRRYNHKHGDPVTAVLDDLHPDILWVLMDQMRRYGYDRWDD